MRRCSSPTGSTSTASRLQIFGLNRHQLFPYTRHGGRRAAAAPGRRDPQERAELQHGALLALPAVAALPRRLRRAGPDGVGGAARLAVRRRRRLAADRAAERARHGGPRPQPPVGHRLGHPAERDRQLPGPVRADPAAAPTTSTGPGQTTGAMASYSPHGWAEDVFGYDDYHATRRQRRRCSRRCRACPTWSARRSARSTGRRLYRWIDTGAVLAEPGADARPGAQHRPVRSPVRGLLGWCAFDYASLNGGERIWDNLKTPGVIDTFRVPKPGAAFYRSQVTPADQPVILPVFFWDFGPGSPVAGPGPDSIIATNCDRLEHLPRTASTSPARHPGHHRLRQPGPPAGLRRPDGRRGQPARAAHRRLRGRRTGGVGAHVRRHHP